jgi:hypothetical protein
LLQKEIAKRKYINEEKKEIEEYRYSSRGVGGIATHDLIFLTVEGRTNSRLHLLLGPVNYHLIG